jgi:hypothetical protein
VVGDGKDPAGVRTGVTGDGQSSRGGVHGREAAVVHGAGIDAEGGAGGAVGHSGTTRLCDGSDGGASSMSSEMEARGREE